MSFGRDSLGAVELDVLMQERHHQVLVLCREIIRHHTSDEVKDLARKIGKILEPRGLWFVDVRGDGIG